MSRLLIIAFEGAEAAQLAGFAKALGIPFDVLSLSGKVDLDLGAAKVFTSDLNELPLADAVSGSLSNFIQQNGPYTHIAGPSSMRGKDLLARLAGTLDAGMVTDVIAIESPTLFHRPMVAGSIIATVEVLSTPVVLTVRPAGFPAPARSGNSESGILSLSTMPKSQRVSVSARGGARPDLTQAKIIVTGGRPLKDAETFERILGGLADTLGGAVGATRAAVDSGIAPNELQVGQTGKIVAPDLYIAAGVSGSTQHMAGIKDSKIIVAINKDPDAPIFESADYGLVADLYDALPELQSKAKA